MKISKYFFTILFLFTFSIFSTRWVNAASINIIRPTDNQKLSGVVGIQWSVFYTGQTYVGYEIRVKNAACSDAGTSISGYTSLPQVQNGYYSYSWDTRNSSDGQACLQVCVQLADQVFECVHRFVQISNVTNASPVITSYPTKLNYKTNEVFKYKVEAYDPDGDALTYKIVRGPSFLYLGQDGFMTMGDYMTAGSHNVSIAVADPKGAAATQNFTLVVEKFVPPPTVKPTSKPSPTTKPTTEPTKAVKNPNFTYLSPTSESIFKGKANIIEWEIKDIEQEISKIKIDYSTDAGKSWKEIIGDGEPGLLKYEWDVDLIPNGKTNIIRTRLIDVSGKAFLEVKSDQFEIANKTVQGDVISIFDIKPSNKAEVDDTTPTISASYSASSGAEMLPDKTQIKLDGSDIKSECTVNPNDFKCELKNELVLGLHNVAMTVEDSNGQSIEQSWSFTVVEKEDSSAKATATPAASAFNFGDLKLDIQNGPFRTLLLCCGGLLLVLVVAFIFDSLRKKKLYMM